MFLLFAVLFSIDTFAGGPDGPEPECSPTPTGPAATIHPLLSRNLEPLKAAYLHLNSFELDTLSSNLAAIENEVDPPSKRKTFSVLVRADTSRQTLSVDRTYEPGKTPLRMAWEGDFAKIWNSKNTYNQYALSLSDIRSLSLLDLEKSLRLKAQGWEGAPTDGAPYKTTLAYLKLTAVADQKGYESATAEIRDSLSWGEKIQLAQMLGGYAGARYDSVRAGGTNPTLLDGSSDPGLSSQYGSNFGGSIPALAILQNLRTGGRLGICRDIAPMQAQFLESVGFKNVYSIAYNAGQSHVAVVTQNPENKNEVLHFDYDNLERADLRQGTKSLTRGQDYSTRYGFFTPDGKSVANLPSELGVLIHEGEGGSIKTLDPFLYRPTGSIAQVSLRGEHGSFPVFTGQTSSGDKIVGIGNTFRYGDSNRNIVSVVSTGGLAYQSKSASPYSTHAASYDALHANLTTAMSVNSHWAPLRSDGAPTEGRVTTTTVLHGDGTRSKSRELGASGNLNFETGLEAKTRSKDGRSTLAARAASQVSLGTQNVSSGLPNRVYHNVSYVSVTGERVVLPEKMTATFNSAVGLREFGPQILVQTGAKFPEKKMSASAGYQGALQKEAFTVAPGMERMLFLDFEKEFKNSLVMTASYQQPTGVAVDPTVQVGVKASPSELLKRKKKPVTEP